MIIDRLIQRIAELQNPTCVGLDTAFSYLPDELRAGAQSAEEKAPAVKVQIAYYEPLGAAGIACFSETCAYAKRRGLFVIADCKRGDIGATAAQYAEAFLGEQSPLGCDLATVNGYLGTDGVAPFLSQCER